jgi:hypothetical protein
MHRTWVRAGLMALALVGGAGAAGAADLDHSMKDTYREKEPYAPYYYHREEPAPRYYDQRSYEPPPVDPRFSRDWREVPPPERYSNYDDRYSRDPRDWGRYDRRGCLSKGEIHYRLKEHGWRDFHDVVLENDVAVVNARRPDGLLYRLQVDRCSGVIVNARLLDDGRNWRSERWTRSSTY